MEGFSEQIIQQKASKAVYLAKIITLTVIVILVCLGFYLSGYEWLNWVVPITLLLIAAGAYMVYNLAKNAGIEYEYTCVGGELRIDRIKARKKRKLVTRVDIKSIDTMGKLSEMDKSKIKPSEYSLVYRAADNLNTDDTYYAVIHDTIKHRPALLYFTPNEKTLDMMRPHLSIQLRKQLFLDQMKKSK